MFSKEFLEILNYECAVGIATCAHSEVHIGNTWNKYLVIKENRILIPAAGMKKTQSNVQANPNVELRSLRRSLKADLARGAASSSKARRDLSIAARSLRKRRRNFLLRRGCLKSRLAA